MPESAYRLAPVDADGDLAVGGDGDADGPGAATHLAVLDEHVLTGLGLVDVGFDLAGLAAKGTFDGRVR